MLCLLWLLYILFSISWQQPWNSSPCLFYSVRIICHFQESSAVMHLASQVCGHICSSSSHTYALSSWEGCMQMTTLNTTNFWPVPETNHVCRFLTRCSYFSVFALTINATPLVQHVNSSVNKHLTNICIWCQPKLRTIVRRCSTLEFPSLSRVIQYFAHAFKILPCIPWTGCSFSPWLINCEVWAIQNKTLVIT